MVSGELTQTRIKQLLKIYGSQRKLAESLGVNQSQISRYLSGKTTPRQAVKDTISKRIYYQTKQKFRNIISESPLVKRFSGKKSDGRRYVRYEFPLWRRVLNDTTKIPALFEKLKQLHRSVQEKDTQIKAQRLGISISTTEREENVKEFFSRKAKRKYIRTEEDLQFITTIIYARNKASTALMFEELEQKLRLYLMGNLGSPDVHEVDTIKEAKSFYVFYEDESQEY